MRNRFSFRRENSPQRRFAKTPRIIGKIACAVSESKTTPKPRPPVSASTKIRIQSGVMKTPSKVEKLASKIAAGTFPRAMFVITTDDETVDGSAAKKKIPSQIPVETTRRSALRAVAAGSSVPPLASLSPF